jgi:hypothetical protein
MVVMVVMVVMADNAYGGYENGGYEYGGYENDKSIGAVAHRACCS